ncbi:hypothetical protein MKZ38_006479 [Zalerion maritima]|uniref:Uncharacterized protein n=1 Tax=Zalerion maritima TaxID=339359 RepID=A0AAD5RZ14_9PEZI|nr:hypothetical protein MKZ38_006479 [Zalerion maritima]
MERDIRRDRGQWRGCYAFRDIVCDGDQPGVQKRDGGLKMGQTYYYYVRHPPAGVKWGISLIPKQYELNGSTEAHDPTMPSTNTCPFLPGQTVNTLHVPTKRPDRKRSASLTSLRKGDYMTMNPNDKYTTPRAAPPVPNTAQSRVPTAPTNPLKHQRSARSLSPSESGWSAKKLFRMRSKERGRDRSTSSATSTSSAETDTDEPSIAPEGSSRSREISPEALRLFLSNDIPAPLTSHESRPTVTIPEDIVEEAEDDDNFATSASSENMPFATILSPPPFQRAHSSSSLASSTATIPSVPRVSVKTTNEERPGTPVKGIELTPTLPSSSTLQLGLCTSHFSISSSEDDVYTPSTPQHEADVGSFFDDSSDGEEVTTNPVPENGVFQQTKPLFSTYSLPRSSEGEILKTAAGNSVAPIGSPALIAGDVPAGNTSLLAAPPAETGFDDLVSELGWMVHYYRSKPV